MEIAVKGLDKLIDNMVLPLATRIGSLASGAVVALGVSSDHAMTFGNGIAILAAVVPFMAYDLFAAYLRKKQVQKKAVANG